MLKNEITKEQFLTFIRGKKSWLGPRSDAIMLKMVLQSAPLNGDLKSENDADCAFVHRR